MKCPGLDPTTAERYMFCVGKDKPVVIEGSDNEIIFRLMHAWNNDGRNEYMEYHGVLKMKPRDEEVVEP